VYFGGGRKAKIYCILRDVGKIASDGFVISKHLKKPSAQVPFYSNFLLTRKQLIFKLKRYLNLNKVYHSVCRESDQHASV